MLARLGLSHLLDARDIVPGVLEQPAVIFEGLRWEGDEDRDRPGWRCYCGTPSFRHDDRGTKVGPYPDQVFVVFVNDERVAYNWRWERAQEDPAIPKGDDRFIRKIYDQREAAQA